MLRRKGARLRGDLGARRATSADGEREREPADDKLKRARLRPARELLEHRRVSPAVSVKDEQVVAAGAIEREVEGVLAPALPRLRHRDAHVPVRKRREQACRLIGRPGIHNDELEVPKGLVLEALHGTSHGLLGVMGHHEHRDLRRCRRVMRHARVLLPRHGATCQTTKPRVSGTDAQLNARRKPWQNEHSDGAARVRTAAPRRPGPTPPER